jgi:phospholipid/cholesterol/gamma-HCH transport system substrate-binding protein
MAERGNEIRVGIMLTICIVVLVVGILWLSGAKFSDRRYAFDVVFQEVGGLNSGDKVTVAGLEAGEVSSLELCEGGSVCVALSVEPTVRIPVDSRFTIGSYGFLGSKHVAVRPGTSSVYIEAGGKVTGAYEKSMNDVISEMGDALTEIRSVLRAADEILNDTEGKDQVRRTMQNAEQATVSLNEALVDLKAMTADVRSFVEMKRDPASEAIDSMAEASESFVEVAGRLETIAASLDTIITRVENGEGTLGKLLTQDDAHDEFMAAVKELRTLVARISENPKSFVKFSIF